MSGATSCPRCGFAVRSEGDRVALAGACPACMARDFLGALDGPAAERFGRYALLERVEGEGAGDVWLARDDASDRLVRLAFLGDGESLAEAASARTSLGAVVEAGEIDGRRFVALEWVEPRPASLPEPEGSLAPKGATSNRLGPYRLIRRLGEGGMGTVYLAEGPEAGRKVAVKVLPKRVRESDGTARKRFLRESAAAIRLAHPNLVRGFEAGEDRGHPFFVMEYCEGESLDRRLKRDGPLPWREALGIADFVAAALGHAHENGVVHRDVKPANILVGTDGVPKLLDLGISKSFGAESDSLRTESGVVLGTPHYVSPEQIRGGDADARSDLYSLGATLFHLVTGRAPFEAATPVETVARHLGADVPDARDLRPDLPEAVALLLKKLLAKSASERPADAAELRRDLRTVLQGGAPVRVGGRRRRLFSALVVLTVLAAAASAVVWSFRRPEPVEPGLVGWWRLDEPSGPEARDSSGGGHHGVSPDAPSPASSQAALRFPNPSARSFDPARRAHLVIPDHPSLRLTGSFTLAAWIRIPALVPHQQGIIEKHEPSASGGISGYFLRVNRQGYVSFHLGSGGSPKGANTAPRSVPLGAWAHIAGVYDAVARRSAIYVDGFLDGSFVMPETQDVAPAAASTAALRLGCDYGINALAGLLDDVRIYDRALGAAEIERLAAGFLSAVGPPVIAVAAPVPASETGVIPATPAGPQGPPGKTIQGKDPVDPGNLLPGLHFAYYEGTWSRLPDFASLRPKLTGVTATFDLGPKLRGDNFGFRFDGFLSVPGDGVYTFATNSDDGSKIFIGGVEVVDNDGAHGAEESSGSIELKAGLHPISVFYFEARNLEVLQVMWKGPGTPKERIPASALWRKGA